MIEHGLMPSDSAQRKALELKDPYELRAKALDEKLSLYELGRALFHINQRRGYKSSRKGGQDVDNDGAIATGIAELELLLRTTSSRTLGEYLAARNRKKEGTRARPHSEQRKRAYKFYPSRAMYEHELDMILNKQRTYYPDLISAIAEPIKTIILYQRPLKPPAPGQCIFESGEQRARLAYPALQTLRIFEQISALEINSSATQPQPPLTQAERHRITEKLRNSREPTFNAIRKLLKRGKEVTFNLETEKQRKVLQGDITSYYLADEDCFGKNWHRLSEERQKAAIDLILGESDKGLQELITQYGLSPTQAQNALDAPLDMYHARLSLKAAHKILPYVDECVPYGDACQRAGYRDLDSPGHAVIYNQLPYYGEAIPEVAYGGTYAEEDHETPETYYGRIGDPTVHVALNQLRKLVNAIITLYGPMQDTIVHIAPEMQQPRSAQQDADQSNESTDAGLTKLGITPTREARLQLVMCQERASSTPPFRSRAIRDYLSCIAPCSVYSGSPTSIALLRHRWGLDDLLNDIATNALKELLPARSRRHDLFETLFTEGDFEDTPLLFHHALDAFAVGSATPSLLETVSREAVRMLSLALQSSEQHASPPLPKAFPNATRQIRSCLDQLIISYKPDHGDALKATSSQRPYTVTKLHEETAYGFAGPSPDDEAKLRFVTRKPIENFTAVSDIESVVDRGWRLKMLAAVRGCRDGSAEFKAALEAFAQNHGVRRLRVHTLRSPETMIPIYKRQHNAVGDAAPYKYYLRGGIYCADIYSVEKNPGDRHWEMELISNFHAHQKVFIPRWQRAYPAEKRLMRLHPGDMVAYREDDITRICRVHSFAEGFVWCMDHRLSRQAGQQRARRLSPAMMQQFDLRKISVDILGRARDPLRKITYRHAA